MVRGGLDRCLCDRFCQCRFPVGIHRHSQTADRFVWFCFGGCSLQLYPKAPPYQLFRTLFSGKQKQSILILSSADCHFQREFLVRSHHPGTLFRNPAVHPQYVPGGFPGRSDLPGTFVQRYVQVQCDCCHRRILFDLWRGPHCKPAAGRASV